MKLVTRVVSGYWTYWGSPVRLRDIPVGYNTVFLFHATPVGGAPGSTGAVQWNTPGNGRGAATNFKADLAEFRKTRSAILTVGGANANVDLANRTRAQAFLDSIKRIYSDLGGFDGLDWNNYEGDQLPHTDQMIWISQQLKATYGQDFAITSPPAPWRETDFTHCRKMIDANVMDLVSPQFYDGPGLATQAAITSMVSDWVSRMGNASRVGVGFGLNPNANNYSSQATVLGAWDALIKKYPTLHGAFNWDMPTDEGLGWPFANNVAPKITAGVITPPPVTPPPPTAKTYQILAADIVNPYVGIAQKLGIARWQDLQTANGGLAPESLKVGQVLQLPSVPVTPPPAATTYTVVSGDTFSIIASKLGIAKWQDIQAANGGIAPESLQVGQVLKIYKVIQG